MNTVNPRRPRRNQGPKKATVCIVSDHTAPDQPVEFSVRTEPTVLTMDYPFILPASITLNIGSTSILRARQCIYWKVYKARWTTFYTSFGRLFKERCRNRDLCALKDYLRPIAWSTEFPANQAALLVVGLVETSAYLGLQVPTGSASWCYAAGCGDEYVSA
jgi:hypothetical protein